MQRKKFALRSKDPLDKKRKHPEVKDPLDVRKRAL
jgi:hypothetical protein